MARFNEYWGGPAPKIAGTYAMTKLKNALLKIQPDLLVELKNVRVNGQLMGCTGFVTNPGNGKVVYVCTDNNHGTSPDPYYREAKSNRDYTGGRNHFSTNDDLANDVVAMLHDVEIDA